MTTSCNICKRPFTEKGPTQSIGEDCISCRAAAEDTVAEIYMNGFREALQLSSSEFKNRGLYGWTVLHFWSEYPTRLSEVQ